MKRILQSLKTGLTEIIETPCPKNKRGHLLIQTNFSLISPGTEKMLINFGKASLLAKAKQQPDKVRDVFEKIKTDGLLETLTAIHNKLDQTLTLGYCNVGTVIEVGEGVEEFSIGDRVASNGPHAEVVCVPKNLCCKIPVVVSNESATFTVLGGIGLQGIRLAYPTLGESFVVIGLGLIGLLTVQLLRAHGCKVLGIDFDIQKLALAEKFGAEVVNLSLGEDPIIKAQQFSKYRGVDGVLITATTRSNNPVHQAAKMCRKRGRIILIGVTGLELSRADFYEKELSFQVSCSYGPGRYDFSYEEIGNDYPIGFVRWTEQRNFEAFLEMLASNRVNVEVLISQQFLFENALQAYQQLSNNEHVLGLLLEYKNHNYQTVKVNIIPLKQVSFFQSDQVCIGFIGAGNYASRNLIPAFKSTEASLKIIACSAGISGTQLGKKYGFEKVTTDTDHIFSDSEINTVVIATRHHNHAYLVCEALKANKHVFVEKPLCISFVELDNVINCLALYPSLRVMVGFNRRFAPHIQKVKSLLEQVNEPKSFIMTVNAGEIPATHWTQDQAIGGGRIIGEVCHFIDLIRFLAASSITQAHIVRLGNMLNDDKVSISLSFADGSFGTIHYLANGHKSFPKERLEIFSSGRILQLDNFRELRGYGWPGFKKMKLWRQDKGQKSCVRQFIDTVKNNLDSPLPIEELIEVSRVTLELAFS
ncbi:MAG TPA: bi-domain-containing oxidoreductase [Gammaproteobacteria bacterium]|nr:bi-domain-containing oxidoreductase [Gammaproteobacteria bacterium]